MRHHEGPNLLNPQGRPFNFYKELFLKGEVNHRLVGSMVETVLSDLSMLDAVANLSYMHELSFDKIVLWRDLMSGCVLRLHIWWPDVKDRSSDTNIHNHGRSFVSHLLIGGYRHQTWQESANGARFFKYRYILDDETLDSDFTELGTERLQQQSERALRAGNNYYLDSDVLHRVLPQPGALTASCVVQSPILSRSSYVFMRNKRRPAEDAMKAAIQKGDLEQKLNRFLDALNRAEGVE